MSRIVILRSRSTAGLEPRVERAARALQQAGHDVRVFLGDRERAYPRIVEREGVRTRRLPLPVPYNQPILLLPTENTECLSGPTPPASVALS